MSEPAPIDFFVDEHLPARLLDAILTARGHRVTPVQIGFKDTAILVTAEQTGAVIITADTWFLTELYRLPAGHKNRYRRAGVVQVPGEWGTARQRITDYLPVIEHVYRLRREQEDLRVGVDLSGTTIRILEAKPSPASGTRRASPSA
jgi:hypothetical protein